MLRLISRNRTALTSTALRLALVSIALAVTSCKEGSSEVAVGPGDSVPDAGAALPSGSCDGTKSAPAPLRLMTRLQYDNTISDLLGDTSQPAQSFPPENTVFGFENNAEAHQATPLLVENLMTAAEGIAARAVAPGAVQVADCGGAGPTLTCAQSFIDSFGRKAFRRPLTSKETALYVDLFQRTQASDGFDRGIELLIQAMLQSPQFLYRAEGRLSPTASNGAVLLDPYTIASRLSYFLYNSMPDQPLFDAAERDELKTPEQIRAQAARMLADDRAQAMVSDFHRQWLGLSRLPSMVRQVSPGVEDPTLGPSYLRSLSAFVTSAYWGGGNLDTLFLSPNYFVDAKLAPLFGASAPVDDTLVQVTEAGSNRAGLLTQPALLAMYAHADQTSPIQRGVFVRERILCQPVPAPPPTVDQTPPDPSPMATTRERFKAHTENPACSVCHKNFDGIGLGLENYDQLGRYRATENDIPIDATGELVATKDPALAGPFNGAVDLSTKLAASSQVSDCVAAEWYRFAMGRMETTADLCSLTAVQTAFASSGNNLQELLVSLTLTDAFRYRDPLPEDGQ